MAKKRGQVRKKAGSIGANRSSKKVAAQKKKAASKGRTAKKAAAKKVAGKKSVAKKKATAKKSSAAKKKAKKRSSGIPREFQLKKVKAKDAVWLKNPVPHDYWLYRKNRLTYMHWLGGILKFKKPEDWYQIKTADLKDRPGGGSLLNHWNSSIIEGMHDCFPNYPWKPWLFKSCPRSFWSKQANHLRYMEWFEDVMNIQDPEDWYNVTNADFKEHKGSGFLTHYNSTITVAIKKFRPKVDWKEWKFAKTPKGFWDVKRNRVRYMKWLAGELGYKRQSDWYDVKRKDFGNQFIKRYDGSPIAACLDCFPKYNWNEWMFSRVPIGFWDDKKNRKRYMDWLAKQLKIKKPSDWKRIRAEDVKNNYGAGLLHEYDSYVDLIKEFVKPLKKWDGT